MARPRIGSAPCIAEQGEGLASICFRTDDIAKMHRRLDRLALKPEPVAEAESRDATTGATLSWKRTRAATELTRGVRLFFLELAKERPRSVPTAAAPITAMDHVVVVDRRSRTRRRALWRAARARHGARSLASGLGPADVLPLRRSHRRGGAPAGQDSDAKTTTGCGALSWRVADIDATRARLASRRRRCFRGAHRPQAGHAGADRAQRHLRHSHAAGGADGASRIGTRRYIGIHADDIRDILDAVARQQLRKTRGDRAHDAGALIDQRGQQLHQRCAERILA